MFLPLQDAAIAAVLGCQDCVEEVRAEYQARRDLLVDGLGSIGWTVHKSPATMFFVGAASQGIYRQRRVYPQAAANLGVLMTPGTAFGAEGEGHVRIALVADQDELAQAIRMIGKSGILGNR